MTNAGPPGPIQYDGIGIISSAAPIRTHPSWHHAAYCEDCAIYNDHSGWNPVWLVHNKHRDRHTPGETRIARWCRKHENARKREAIRLRRIDGKKRRPEEVTPNREETITIAKVMIEAIIHLEAIIK